METFKCKGPCGKWKPTTSYYVRKKGRKKRDGNNVYIVPELSRDPVCKDCRFEERRNPIKKIPAKVRAAITHEASKLGVTSSQLHEWGVTFEWVKYMLLREIELVKNDFHFCPNCQGNPDPTKMCYADGTIDIENFTFDVIDPERMYRTGKLTRSNCRWICEPANKAKGSKDPTENDLEVYKTYLEQEAIKKGFQADFPSPDPEKNKTIPLFT